MDQRLHPFILKAFRGAALAILGMCHVANSLPYSVNGLPFLFPSGLKPPLDQASNEPACCGALGSQGVKFQLERRWNLN